MNSFLKELSKEFFFIDDTLSDEDFLKSLFFLPEEYIDDLFNYLNMNYISMVNRIIQNQEDYIKKGDIISIYIKPFKSFNTNIVYAYISSKICYIIKNKKQSTENTIEILSLIGNTSLIKKKTNTKSLKTTLKPYQEETLNELKSKDKSIVIAKTGSGKTLLTIAYAEYLYYNNYIDDIIIVVERTPEVFYREIRKHLNTYSSMRYNKIYTYFNIKNFLKPDEDYSRTLFIFDEVHLLKNISKRGLFMRNIKISYFLGVTATIVDREKDLKTLFKNLGIEKGLDNISHYILQMKNSSIEDGYEINRIKKTLELNNSERATYDYEISKKDTLFGMLNSGLRYLSTTYGKLAEIYDIVKEHSEDQILIYCNYIDTVHMIKNHLSYLDVSAVSILGENSKAEKSNIVTDFISGRYQVMITTNILKASYNLQNANVVIMCDYNFSVIGRIQSEGRVKRIGQNKPIYIYDIVYKDTYEEYIVDIIESKRDNLDELQDSVIMEESIRERVGDLL